MANNIVPRIFVVLGLFAICLAVVTPIADETEIRTEFRKFVVFLGFIH